MGEILASGIVALLSTIFLGPKFIEFLRRHEYGQHIREEGPQTHRLKQDTPTMGGLLIFLAMAIPFFIFSHLNAGALAVFTVIVLSAAIGFIDDYMKVAHRRSLGLSGRWKMLFQTLLTLGLGYFLIEVQQMPTQLVIPFVGTRFELGLFYYVLIFFVLVGASNAVNLTDGLDGLAAGTAATTILAYTAIAFLSGQQDLGILTAALVGASMGFLWFNSFPASVFMGDTGALGLGGAIAALAIVTQTEILLIVLGGLFVVEALSVIAQVLSFRLFGKRLFLMTPIHHHFELAAWSETKIIVRFWIVSAIFAAIGFTFYYGSMR